MEISNFDYLLFLQVFIAVTTTKSMQSVTNIFIVNLAMADMLVMLFCAPPSVIWDVTNTWIFGSVMCKVVIYTQVRNIDSKNAIKCIMILKLRNTIVILIYHIVIYRTLVFQ